MMASKRSLLQICNNLTARKTLSHSATRHISSYVRRSLTRKAFNSSGTTTSIPSGWRPTNPTLYPTPTPTHHRYASTLASDPPSGESVLVSSPSRAALEEEQVDLEQLPSDVSIRITERAAEQLRTISTRESDPNVALRIAVESGGCHGYQYKLELGSLNEESSSSDFHFMHPTKQPSHVLVDPVSLTLLKGSTLDFSTELIGSSFRILENPQASGGCGCGVSWEAKL